MESVQHLHSSESIDGELVSRMSATTRGTLLASFVLITVSIAAAYSFELVNIEGQIDEFLKHGFTILSIIVLTALVCTNFYAYQLNKDTFYLFLTLAWVGNLFYIVFVTSAADTGQSHLSKKYEALLALVSFLPFYFAGCLRTRSQELYLRDLVIPFIAIAALAVFFLVELESDGFNSVLFVGISIFSFWSLYRVSQSIQSRINPDYPDSHLRLVALTYLVYAFIQLFYLLIPFSQYRPVSIVIESGFFIALVLKSLNLIALVFALRDHFAIIKSEKSLVEERLLTRSEFEELGVLTASIEHELRTPLGVINSEIINLKRKYQSNEELMRRIDLLDKQRVRMLAATQIVNTLRGRRENFVNRMESVHVADLVRRSVRDVKRELALDEQIHFSIDEKKMELHARAFPPLLQQSFTNVIKNAVESIFSDRSNGGVEIEIGSSDDGSSVYITFADNGRGFKLEDLDKITKPSYTTKPSDSDRVNNGLGLFVCDRVIKIHGGSLDFYNNSLNGGTVRIVLPRLYSKKRKKEDDRVSSSTTEERRQ